MRTPISARGISRDDRQMARWLRRGLRNSYRASQRSCLRPRYNPRLLSDSSPSGPGAARSDAAFFDMNSAPLPESASLHSSPVSSCRIESSRPLPLVANMVHGRASAGYGRRLENIQYIGNVGAKEEFHICSMAQVYPENRGTNYAIRERRKISARLAIDGIRQRCAPNTHRDNSEWRRSFKLRIT
jgi:hypothetical protein